LLCLLINIVQVLLFNLSSLKIFLKSDLLIVKILDFFLKVFNQIIEWFKILLMSPIFLELIILILDKLWLHLGNRTYLLVELLIHFRNEFFFYTNLLLANLNLWVFIRNIFFQGFQFLNQLFIFIFHVLSEFIIKLIYFLIIRDLILVIKRERRVFSFKLIKLVFEIFKFISQWNDLFNLIFNLLLMVKLNLSKPLINGLIIFLNDTLYHPFSI
jgi:hypothetical protein